MGNHVFIDPESRLMQNPRDAMQVKRHEVDEIVVGNKLKKRYGKGGVTQVRKNGEMVGQHRSPRVIARELQRKARLDRMYGTNKSAIDSARRSTGEYRAVRKLTARQLRKAEKNAADHLPGMFGRMKHAYKVQMKTGAEGADLMRKLKFGNQWNVSDLKSSTYADVPDDIKGQIKKHKRHAKRLKNIGKTAAAATAMVSAVLLLNKYRQYQAKKKKIESMDYADGYGLVSETLYFNEGI